MTTETAYRMRRSQVWTGDRKTDAQLVVETLGIAVDCTDAELADLTRGLLADYAARYPE